MTQRLDAVAGTVLDAAARVEVLCRWIWILGSAGVAVAYACGRWTLARAGAAVGAALWCAAFLSLWRPMTVRR